MTREVLNMGFAGKRISERRPLADRTPDNNCVAPHPNAIIRLQRYRDTATGAQCGQAAPRSRHGHEAPTPA